MCSILSNEYKPRNFDLYIDYDELMKLIDSIKMASGCDEVALYGNDQTFEKLMELGFPLGEFKCENVSDMFPNMFDEPRLYIIPIENRKDLKVRFI